MLVRLSFLAAGVLAGALTIPPSIQHVLSARVDLSPRDREVAALRAHFDSVDNELRSRPGLHLTPGQRTARLTLIGWLRDYRHAGAFPRNDRLPVPMPFFRDSEGALCAMAYLIDRSGRQDLVDRIARTRNNAFIVELADDAELRAWLDSAGLTVAEAARIQPTYEPIDELEDEVSSDYALTSILVSGTSLMTVGLNLLTPRPATAWAGVFAGTLGTMAGVAHLDGNDGTKTVAAANMIAGGAAMAVGLYRLFKSRSEGPVDGLSPRSSELDPQLAINPLVLPTADGPRVGLEMHARF